MKRSIIVIMLLLLGGAIFAGWYANQVTEAKDQATATVTSYIDAVKVGNVEVAMSLSRDKRFANEKLRQAAYQQLFTDSPMQSAEILNLERVDNTQMNVTLSITGERTGNQVVSIPVVKDEENEQWMLLLDNMSIESSPATPQ